MLMPRTLIFCVLALALLLSSSSCKTVTPSGSKVHGYGQFSFLINNNQVSKAPIYKRYVSHKKGLEF
jgi:hypothetical protein